MDITCQPGPGPALDLSEAFPPAEAPDLFDDTRPDPLPAWSGRLPANRDQMLACVCGLWAQAPSCLPATLASLARALGGPAMPPQSLHDMVQALQACGAGDALAQARWPEVTQVLATALGGPDLCEDHRDGLVRLASLPASLRLGPAWLVVEALARAVGGSAMAPRHSAGLGVALRRGEYLACPENIAALLHVLGAAPACAGDAARQDANLQAAIVKDVGALFEQALPDIARELIDAEPDPRAAGAYASVLANIVHNAPSWSLRGGTREILRGIIARGLGTR